MIYKAIRHFVQGVNDDFLAFLLGIVMGLTT